MTQRFPSQVTLRDVSRTFGRTFALHRVDLDLEAGTIYAIAGDNGAGKSTLLNLLATVDEPTSGQLHYGDLPLAQFRRRARHRIGWVSHSSLLYDELTARENLRFFGRMYGIDELEPRVDRWLERVDLDDVAHRSVHTFSSGMKQRLTIARALIQNPQLLLFDEPATGLDQQGNRFVIQLLRRLADQGRIIVVVSHDFDLLEQLADQLVILHRGKVRFDGPLDKSVDLPETYRTHA